MTPWCVGTISVRASSFDQNQVGYSGPLEIASQAWIPAGKLAKPWWLAASALDGPLVVARAGGTPAFWHRGFHSCFPLGRCGF